MARNILVIDGQGGSLGKEIVARLKAECPEDLVTAIGTNSIATQNMLKAKPDRAATGENPVVVNAFAADIIAGPIGIIAVDSLLGEVTEKMALAVARSRAVKYLIPVNQCSNIVVGVPSLTMNALLDDLVAKIKAGGCCR